MFIFLFVMIILGSHKHLQVATISIMQIAIFFLRFKRGLLWQGLLLNIVRGIVLAEAIPDEIHAAISALLVLLVSRATADGIARGL